MGEAKRKDQSRKIYADQIDVALESLEINKGDILIVKHDPANKPEELTRIAQQWHIWGNRNGILVAIVPQGSDITAMPFELLERIYRDAKRGHEQRVAAAKPATPPAEREPGQEG